MKYGLKAKTIIIIALGIDELLRVSHYDTAREIWDTIQITCEGTNEV